MTLWKSRPLLCWCLPVKQRSTEACIGAYLENTQKMSLTLPFFPFSPLVLCLINLPPLFHSTSSSLIDPSDHFGFSFISP